MPLVSAIQYRPVAWHSVWSAVSACRQWARLLRSCLVPEARHSVL